MSVNLRTELMKAEILKSGKEETLKSIGFFPSR
jgi:hypothetical protein